MGEFILGFTFKELYEAEENGCEDNFWRAVDGRIDEILDEELLMEDE